MRRHDASLFGDGGVRAVKRAALRPDLASDLPQAFKAQPLQRLMRTLRGAHGAGDDITNEGYPRHTHDAYFAWYRIGFHLLNLAVGTASVLLLQ